MLKKQIATVFQAVLALSYQDFKRIVQNELSFMIFRQTWFAPWCEICSCGLTPKDFMFMEWQRACRCFLSNLWLGNDVSTPPLKKKKKLNTKWQEKVVIHQQNAILYSNAICIESAKHTVLTFPILWSRKIHSMWTQWKCVTDQSVSYPNLTHTVKIQKERTVLPKPNRTKMLPNYTH